MEGVKLKKRKGWNMVGEDLSQEGGGDILWKDSR